jgi:type I restriction enzyme, S subunit
MVVENGFKLTEVGVIPNEWNLINLGVHFSLKARIGWQGLTTAEYLKSGDYILVTGTDFNNGFIDWDNCVFVEKKRFDQDKNIQLLNNDILVTKDGTIGKVAFIDKLPLPTTLNSGVFVIRPKTSKIHSKFFYYVLMSFYFDKFLNRITAGSTITHLYQKDFIYFNLILPPLPEQTAIASALSDMDSLIAQTERLIEKKKAIKQGVMQELLRPKEGWNKNKISEVYKIFKGRGLSKGKLHESGENSCILYGELFTTYKEEINEIFGRTSFNEGVISVKEDILFPGSTTTTGADLAKASTLSQSGVQLGGDIIILRKSLTELDSLFVTYFLNCFRKNQIAQLTKGITIHHLYGKDLLDIEIEFPEYMEQIKNIKYAKSFCKRIKYIRK